MIRVSIEGTVLEGRAPIDIICLMRASASPWQLEGTLRQYMDRVVERFQLFGKDVHARGRTDEERAASLLDGLIACGYARLWSRTD
jgi:hypothetical protein